MDDVFYVDKQAAKMRAVLKQLEAMRDAPDFLNPITRDIRYADNDLDSLLALATNDLPSGSHRELCIQFVELMKSIPDNYRHYALGIAVTTYL